MVKKLFLFLAITAGLLTSCKDYDDDIDRLDADITELQSTLTSQSSAITAVQSSVTTQIGTLKTQLEAAIAAGDNAAKADAAAALAKANAVETSLTALNAQITALNTQLAGKASQADMDAAEALIATLSGKVDAINTSLATINASLTTMTNRLDAIEAHDLEDDAEIANIKELLAIQTEALENFKTLMAGDLAGINTKIDGILTDIAALQNGSATKEELSAAVEALDAKIAAFNPDLSVLTTAINNMITNITLLNSALTGVAQDIDLLPVLYYTTTVAKQTLTFAPSVQGAISFVEGERLLSDESSIVVQVSPANADLSLMLSKIYLVDSKGNTAINGYIHAVKAERYTDLLAVRSASTNTGLWKITFQLPAESNFEELAYITTDNGDPIIYAVAIENTIAESEVERNVVSEFGCLVGARDIDGIGELGFAVKGANDTDYTSHTLLRNRYDVTESGVTAPKDYRWSNSDNRLASDNTTEDDPEDVRSTASYKFVEAGVNQPFYVQLNTWNQQRAYAYYVALDKNWAVESSPSEINAWNSYSYEGLNKIYMANEIATLKITSQAANGDIIGFRVFAVNADGTLVDPDGKSFYVYVGDLASSALAFEQTFANAVLAAGTPVPSNKLAFAPAANLANVASAEFIMTIGSGAPLNNDNLQLLGTGDAILGDADLVNWSAVKKLQIIGVDPARMEENATYTGTLILKNSLGVAFSQTIITFKKILPTFTPGANIAYKTNILHNGVIYGYPKPDNSYDLTTAFNINTSAVTLSRLTVTNNSGYANMPAWTGTIADVDDVIISSSNVYDLTLGYNYGYILFDGTQYSAPWDADPDIKVNFRSYVQDLTGWRYTTAPALQYATDATFNVVNVKAMPPAGSEINMTQNESALANLQDGRAFTITGVKVLTGATFTTVNEYFTPTFDPLTEIISLDAVITSPPAGPVPTKLQLKLTDDFGHSFTYTIDATFNMVLN